MAITTIIPEVAIFPNLSQNPSCARLEERQILASDGTIVKRRVIVFPDNVDGIVDPEIIVEFMAPSQYPSTTGFQLRLALLTENGVITGNVVFGLSVENILDTGSSTKVANSNSQWGTEATATITVAGVANEVKMSTIDLAKGNFGGDTSAAGTTAQLMRVRIRRLTSNASDTLVGNILACALQLAETG